MAQDIWNGGANPFDVKEADARILYNLTVTMITSHGEKKARNRLLCEKHMDAMLRRHGEETTLEVMDAVKERIAEIVAEKKHDDDRNV